MNGYIFAGIVLLILVGSIALTIWCTPRGPQPEVKPLDMIDEEIRAERLELHNDSLTYAEMQGVTDRHMVVMLAAAFRSGAQWQQRRP